MNMRLYSLPLLAALALSSVGCSTTGQREADRLVADLGRLEPGQSAVACSKRLTALGETAVPALLPLLQSDRVRDRINAAWVLAEVGSPLALRPLAVALLKEHDETAKDIMVQAICSVLEIPNNVTPEVAVRKARESNQSITVRRAAARDGNILRKGIIE